MITSARRTDGLFITMYNLLQYCCPWDRLCTPHSSLFYIYHRSFRPQKSLHRVEVASSASPFVSYDHATSSPSHRCLSADTFMSKMSTNEMRTDAATSMIRL